MESNETIRRTLAHHARVFVYKHSPSHSDRISERFRMFEAKSELRKIKSNISRTLKVTIAIAIAFSITSNAVAYAAPAPAAPKLPATVSFLSDAFDATDIQAPMTSGFAIEAFAQLAGANLTAKDLSVAVRTRLSRTNRVLGTSSNAGYLMNSATYKIKPGLAGKYLFTTKLLKFGTTTLEDKVTSLLRAEVSSSGTIVASAGNAQDVAWVVLGLQASKQPTLASKVARALIRMQHSDGGFNYDPTMGVGGTDVTAIVIQALQAVKMPDKTSTTNRNRAVSKAVAFLKANTVGGNHFEAYGDVDANGTAYAIMALTSAGVSAGPYVRWLKTKLNSDGGLQAPWTAGGSDRYVTAQAYLPLIGKSYVSLLSGK